METTATFTDDNFLDLGELFYGTPIEINELENDDGSETWNLVAGDPDYQA